jgi:hypothetical protein
MAQLGESPRSWVDLFDFLRYLKTKAAMREEAMAAAKIRGG